MPTGHRRFVRIVTTPRFTNRHRTKLQKTPVDVDLRLRGEWASLLSTLAPETPVGAIVESELPRINEYTNGPIARCRTTDRRETCFKIDWLIKFATVPRKAERGIANCQNDESNRLLGCKHDGLAQRERRAATSTEPGGAPPPGKKKKRKKKKYWFHLPRNVSRSQRRQRRSGTLPIPAPNASQHVSCTGETRLARPGWNSSPVYNGSPTPRSQSKFAPPPEKKKFFFPTAAPRVLLAVRQSRWPTTQVRQQRPSENRTRRRVSENETARNASQGTRHELQTAPTRREHEPKSLSEITPPKREVVGFRDRAPKCCGPAGRRASNQIGLVETVRFIVGPLVHRHLPTRR